MSKALEALKNYEQADMDGTMVRVSRQAVDEVVAEYSELMEALKECRTDLLITANNAEDAAKRDTKWVGVGSALRRRIEQADAAIAKAQP